PAGLAPPGGGPREWVGAAAVAAVALAMTAGALWGGRRVLAVLAHRVTTLEAATGVTANLGTAALVLLASPLGLPVSTTHVSTGSLLGARWAARRPPREADALRAILWGWLVTFPAAGLVAALAHRLLAG
ncbi:MAG: inorganic phosphate transporter, partial [Gammaproteobacteria bacterium]